MRSLSSGVARAWTRSAASSPARTMPSSRAIAPAVIGLVARDHDGVNAGLARGGDGRDRLAARRIGDPDDAQQPQILLLDAGADGDAQHAQATRRHVGVRLGRARRPRRTQRKQQLGRALDVEHPIRSPDRHALAVGVERVHVPPRALLLDRSPIDPTLGGRREQRELGGISRAGASAFAQLGVAACGGGRQQLVVIRPPKLAHGHHARGQRAGLVGADDRRAAQRLDRRQPANENVARRHPLDADRQRDGDDRRQALGHGGDRQRHRRDEHLQRRPATRQNRAPR